MTTGRPERPTRTPRTGRRPRQAGAAGTREAIVEAARRLFAERGFESASMRAIGAEAGVDAALITHFFGSKANLLAASLDWPFDPDQELPGLLEAGRDRVGERLVALFVRTWDREGSRNPVITLLRAASSEPAAANLLAEFMRARLFGPLLAELGSDQPELRANLVASQLGGLGLTRYILGFEPLASARPQDVIRWTAPTIQRYLTGRL
ncbi:MAG: TetR family transcriptional regulator [Solirubrobacterales bacterium]|nr:TetR family transcriptional regulator [Solirubrobacterales bacterium]